VTVTLGIGARQFTQQMQVSNDGGFSGAVWEPYASSKAWQITQYGSYVIPRVVYVRYKDLGGSISSNYQDDIILDVTAPTGTVEAIPLASNLRTWGSAPMTVASLPAPAIGVTESYTYTVYLPFVRKDTTGPANITLQLSAQDDVSGVADMLISNAAGFDSAGWEPYATAKAWYVPPGTATIYVEFRDNAGNVSEVFSDSINMP
jgi:hypothetical protein